MPQMFHGDCFDIMSDDERIPAGSVNLILCDPPFGCTANAWDSPKTNPYDLTKIEEDESLPAIYTVFFDAIEGPDCMVPEPVTKKVCKSCKRNLSEAEHFMPGRKTCHE